MTRCVLENFIEEFCEQDNDDIIIAMPDPLPPLVTLGNKNVLGINVSMTTPQNLLILPHVYELIDHTY